MLPTEKKCRKCGSQLFFRLDIDTKQQPGMMKCSGCGREFRYLDVDLELAFDGDNDTLAVKCADGRESIIPRAEVEEFLLGLINHKPEKVL